MTIDERRELFYPLAESLLALRGREGIVAVYTHLNADGDAYGSAQSLMLCLRKIGLDSIAVYEEPIKKEFHYLPGLHYAKDWSDMSDEARENFTAKQILAVEVDLSVNHRLADRRDAYESAPVQIVIDHHLSEREADKDFLVYSEAAATCELIYSLAEALEEKSGQEVLDHDIAVCLYTGLLTDTGNFSYPNVRPLTLEVASRVLRFEVDVPDLVDRHFRKVSWARYQAEGALRGHTKRTEDGRITYLAISQELLNQYGADDADLEAIPSQLRDIEGTEVALMLRETTDGSIRGNLRSQPEIDIQTFADELGGGGHKNAAGFTLPPADLEETIEELVRALAEKLES